MKKLVFSLFLSFQAILHTAVYDCFTFCNEFDLLEVRLDELNDVVDYFVLVEGALSFKGNPKPLHFEENKERFAKYKDKIIHIVLRDFPPLTGNDLDDHWAREKASRNAISQALTHCNSDDVIFISDLDEIPKKSAVKHILAYLNALSRKSKVQRVNRDSFVCELSMNWYMFYLNCLNHEMLWVGGSKAVPYWFLKQSTPWDIKIYHHFHSNTYKVPNAGWHFHSMGGTQQWQWKWMNTAPDIEIKTILDGVKANDNFIVEFVEKECATRTIIVPIDDTYPDYIRRNIDYFTSKGWVMPLQKE